MSGNKKVYDLAFGIGEACSCTQTLRKSNLQIASYPFDWLYGSDFIGRCKILASKFDRFIEKTDLEFAHEERSFKCLAYHNKYNDITFNHDFLKNLNFEEAYKQVKEKYNRRIKRLLEQIKNSSEILIVYIETPTTNHEEIDNKTIIEGYNIIKSAFSKNIDLLYISNNKNKQEIVKISDNITKITNNYKSTKTEDPDWEVNRSKTKSFFKNYCLNLPFSYRVKKQIVSILVSLIPIKHFRHKLERRYHV